MFCVSLTTGGFKSPGRGRGGGAGMKGGKKVIIEAHRHEGTHLLLQDIQFKMLAW